MINGGEGLRGKLLPHATNPGIAGMTACGNSINVYNDNSISFAIFQNILVGHSLPENPVDPDFVAYYGRNTDRRNYSHDLECQQTGGRIEDGQVGRRINV